MCGEEEFYGCHKLVTMLNVAYSKALNGVLSAGRPKFSRSRSGRAEPAPALFRGHRDQSHGGAAARQAVSRRLARLPCARGHRPHGLCRSPEAVAPPPAADLARTAQRRDDRGCRAALPRLAAQAGVHLGGATASYLVHTLAYTAEGTH